MTVLDDLFDLRLTVQNLYKLLRYFLDCSVYRPADKSESKLKIYPNIKNMIDKFIVVNK